MGEKHHIASVVYKLMSMGRWWNDTERGKSEVLEEKRHTASVVDQ